MVQLVKQNLKENKEKYKKVKKNILDNIKINMQIEHVGSTAIPNMYGKNILDILIGVDNVNDFKTVKEKLEQIGFIASEKSKNDIYTFLASTKEETKAGDTHIHLVIKDTQRFNDFLILRDYLLNNPEEATAYSNFKKELIKNSITDREEYKRIKSEFVSNLIQKARKYAKITNK